MTDHSDYLLTGILLLLFGTMLLGFHDLHKDQINERLEREEQVWREAVGKSKARECFKESLERVYLVEGELWTGDAGVYFDYCMKQKPPKGG